MIKRQIQPALMQLAKYFPVVTLLGPRQSGKTTLAQMAFPKHAYVNLEDTFAFKLATEDSAAFFEQYKPPVIIDEIQRIPALLSQIQVMADKQKKKGMFILTGSHQPALHAGISQSLAGRVGILRLLPFSFAELSSAGIKLSRDEYIFKGFMPGVYADKIPPNLFYANYYRTYVERDVRQLINIGNQRGFEVFIKLLAGRVGQIVNLNSMSGDVGVSSTTLATWLSVLEASYIIFRLPCYFNNFGKRLIKSPKIYFTEVGLAAWLLGIENATQVFRDPLLGGLFENMVIMEALKTRYNQGKEPELYYFRDQHGLEVDLCINHSRNLQPIEIKAAQTYDSSLAKNIHSFLSFANNAIKPTIVYAGEQNVQVKGVSFVNFSSQF
ncbi:MAG: ATP-binding protein [Fibromonadaceae bacterium]|jgi:predicted AAA+ superfamily ATPase|nr:ATP-binding protein [Fibromonadaceae bacterium]